MKRARNVYFSEISYYVYVRRQNSIMTNTIFKKEGFSINGVLVLERILTLCTNLSPFEKRTLLSNFLFLAERGCPKSEKFHLFFFLM